MKSALRRYRVMAYIVGVLLLILTFVGIPLQVLAHNTTVVSIVGTLHGFLYMVYLVTAFDLSLRVRWPLSRTVLVMLAGTIPALTFVAEHKVHGWVNAKLAQQDQPAQVPVAR